MRYIIVVLTAGVVAACHSPAKVAQAPVPAMAADSGSCPVVLKGSKLRDWRLVRASGFMFCVPKGWSENGSRWERGGTSIEWGFGSPPPRTASKMIVVPAGSDPRMAAGALSDTRTFSEEIDGREARLYENRFDQTFYTGAVFERAGIYLVGQAEDRGSANVTLDIFRTVRFLLPSS